MRRQRDRVAVEGSGCASNEKASSVLSIREEDIVAAVARRPSGRDAPVAPDGRPAPDPGGRSARRGTATATQPSTGSPSGRWVEVLASRAAEDGQALPTAAARGGRGQPQRGPETWGYPRTRGCGMVRMSVESVGPPLERRPDAPNIRGVCHDARRCVIVPPSQVRLPRPRLPARQGRGLRPLARRLPGVRPAARRRSAPLGSPVPARARHDGQRPDSALC